MLEITRQDGAYSREWPIYFTGWHNRFASSYDFDDAFTSMIPQAFRSTVLCDSEHSQVFVYAKDEAAAACIETTLKRMENQVQNDVEAMITQILTIEGQAMSPTRLRNQLRKLILLPHNIQLGHADFSNAMKSLVRSGVLGAYQQCKGGHKRYGLTQVGPSAGWHQVAPATWFC